MSSDHESTIVPYKLRYELDFFVSAFFLTACAFVTYGHFLVPQRSIKSIIAYATQKLIPIIWMQILYINYRMFSAFRPEYSCVQLLFLASFFESLYPNISGSSTLFITFCASIYGPPHTFHYFLVRLMDKYLSIMILVLQGVACVHRQDRLVIFIPKHITYPIFQNWYVRNVTYIILEGSRIKYSPNICYHFSHVSKLVLQPNVRVEGGSFSGFYGIQELEIKDNTTIGAKAFENCWGLKKIVLSIDSNVSANAFTGCEAPRVYVGINETHLKSRISRSVSSVKQQLALCTKEVVCKIKKMDMYANLFQAPEMSGVAFGGKIGLMYSFKSSGIFCFQYLPPKVFKKLLQILCCFRNHAVVIPDHLVLRHIIKVPSVNIMMYYNTIDSSEENFNYYSVCIQHELLRS